MPELRVAGDIFKLGAGGEFDGVWMSSGRLQGEVGISYQGRAVFCHGLDAAVAIEAAAAIEAALTVFLPSVRAEGRAFAAAGAGVQVQVSPNIFEKVGLSVDARAFAQASVAGRIALGLDFQEIAELAKSQLSDLAYQIFIAFLNELIVQAGVWGRASFAAMAEAHLEINGTVIGDDAGFQITAGAGAGWGGGTAWDFFARLELDDPRRFYTTAVELIVAELARVARSELGDEHRSGIELFELVAPIAAVTAYDLGEIAADELMRPADLAVEPFLKAFAQRLAFYVLDKLVALGQDMIASALTEAIATLASTPLTAAQRTQLDTQVDALLNLAGDDGFDSDTVVDALGPLVNILELLRPETAEQWRQPVALVWSAAVTARTLRRSAARAGVTVSVLGRSTGVSGAVLAVPAAPGAVRDAYDDVFSPAPATIEFADVIDYLGSFTLDPLIESYLPDTAAVLDQVGGILDLTLGDVVAGALTATVGEDLTHTELYEKLRDFTKDTIEGTVSGDLLPELKTHLADPDLVRYVDEVIDPVLLASSGFVFDQVDELVAGISLDRFDPFNQSFKAGLGELVWLVFARNVVFITDVLLDRVTDHLHDGFRELEQEVRDDPGNAMAAGALTIASATFGAFNPVREDHVEAVRLLVADLAGAGAAAFGPSIWTHQRRVELKTLTRRLLEHGDAASYSDPSELQRIAEQFSDCYFIPDIDGITAMVGALSELTADEFQVVTELVAPAFELFFYRLTTQTLREIEQVAVDFIAGVADQLRQAWETLQQLRAEVDEQLHALAEYGAQVDETLDLLSAALASQEWRNQVLSRLLSDTMDAAEASARAAPGFDLLPADQQAAAVATARGGADLAFALVRPAIDIGLQAATGALDEFGDLVAAAASAPAAATEAADAIGAAVVSGVSNALADAGLALPPELSIETIEETVVDTVLGVTGVRHLLDDAIEARQAQLEADAQLRRLRDDEAAADNAHREKQALQSSLIGETRSIDILSPAALDVGQEDNWIYPRQIPVLVRLAGARPSYVQPDSPARILVAVNGQAIGIDPQAARYDSDRGLLEMRLTVSAGLRHGLNTLEVSVVDTGREPVRAAVSFLANPDLDPFGAVLDVVGDQSQFDAPGDDHQATVDEYVTIRNRGDQPMSLKGCKLYDRVRHRYVFGDIELFPLAVVKLHTGPGTDSDTDLYWGRGQAVWNNRGDTVYIVDPDGVLLTEFAY